MTQRRYLTVTVLLMSAMISALAFSRFAVWRGFSNEWRDTPSAVVAVALLIWLAFGAKQKTDGS